MSEKSPKYRTAEKPAAPYSFDPSKQHALQDRKPISPDEWYQALVINAPKCHHPGPQMPLKSLQPTSEVPSTPLVISAQDAQNLPPDRMRRGCEDVMETTVPYVLGASAIEALLKRS